MDIFEVKFYFSLQVGLDLCPSINIHGPLGLELVIPDDYTKGYCNSCGFKFRPQSLSFYVNQCEICEDYALCKKCMVEGMHKKHAGHLKRVRALDYIHDIG